MYLHGVFITSVYTFVAVNEKKSQTKAMSWNSVPYIYKPFLLFVQFSPFSVYAVFHKVLLNNIPMLICTSFSLSNSHSFDQPDHKNNVKDVFPGIISVGINTENVTLKCYVKT